jgi:G3E family GTPase
MSFQRPCFPDRTAGRLRATGPAAVAKTSISSHPMFVTFGGKHHDHGAAFSTWSFETVRPVSLDVLQEIVRRNVPASVYRCKGIVHAADAPGVRTVLQVVGRRTEVSLAGAWGDEVPRTRIVAIGAPGEMETIDLDAMFERCLASAITPTAASQASS